MPQIAKYKALGGSLGAYKKTLSDVQSKEYAKDFASYKDEQRRSMYGAIGGTVANIIGIAQEMKGIKKLKGYAESAKGLPGVEERDGSYFSRMSGKELSSEQLQSIGYMESLGISTKYGEFATRPDVPFEPAEIGGEPESIAFDFVTDKAESFLGEEVDLGEQPKVEFDINKFKDQMNPEGDLGEIPKVDDRGEPFDFFAQKDVIGEPRQYEMSSMSDSSVFDITKGDFDNPIFESGIGKPKMSSLQNMVYEKVGEAGGSYAQKVAYMESRYGANTGKRGGSRYGSIFQYRRDEIDKGVIGVPKLETKKFLEDNKLATRGFDKTGPGGRDSIYSIGAEVSGISGENINYLAHQQGRGGIQDIVTSAKSGVLSGGGSRISKMLGNLSNEDRDYMINRYGKGAPGVVMNRLSKNDIMSFSSDFLRFQKKYWGSAIGGVY